MLLLWMACASNQAAFAVNVMSLIPSEKGLTGTQTWQFFDSGWAKNRNAKHYICGRAQSVVGTVVAPPSSCTGCDNAYQITPKDVDSDCGGDEAEEKGFAATIYIAVGKVSSDIADMDPHPDDSLGWYLSTDGEAYEPWGFAYDEALDFDGGVPGPSLWSKDRVYTLKPAVALEL